MALTKQDVLDTLSSYFVQLIDFQVGTERISAVNYNAVKIQMENGRIQVVPWANTVNAQYDPNNNTLSTQNVPSPPDPGARALLVHECTHAIVNVEKRAVTELTNETMAYIAQHVYLLLVNPLYVVPPNNPPWFHFFNSVVKLVKKYKLHKPEGKGSTVSFPDYMLLRHEISTLYTSVGYIQDAPALGPSSYPPMEGHVMGVSHEDYPEASDAFLTDTLKRRYDTTDVIGYGGRVKHLEGIFSHMEPIRAHAVRDRLAIRRQGDPMSIYFHDNLSTPTRTSLLGILARR